MFAVQLRSAISLFILAPEDQEVIGPDGIEAFCKDLGVNPEDPVMLVLAYKMDAKQMGYFTRKEWNKGLQDLQYVFISNQLC